MNKLLFFFNRYFPMSYALSKKIFTFFLFFILVVSTNLSAQSDTIPTDIQNLIENAVEDGGGNGENFEYNDILQNLEVYRRKPLNLNKARIEELEDLQLLSDIQIADLISYRAEYGDLISLEELQVIPSFDLQTIQNILPYAAVKGSVDDYNLPLKEMLFRGKNEFFIRYQRLLETQRGYIEGEYEDPYLGRPFRVYTRFQHSYENKFSVGFTAENDPGEEFFTGSNKQGFDFYSAHLFLRDYSKTIKAIAIGDYNIALGQGLIARAGFGYGKSAQVMDIRRTSRTLSPQRSANEFDFFRGAAATFGFGENIETSIFYSNRKRDANILTADLGDSIDIDQPIDDLGFSSFQNTGFHRYKAEIDDEKAITLQSMGGNIKYKLKSGHISLNTIYHQFDQSLNRNLVTYNQFEFNNDQLFNVSLDYAYIYRNIHFFGETAYSDNNSIATLNGLLIGMNRKLDFSILHRHYPVDFHSLNARPFGETTAVGGKNENGVYLGLEIRPSNRWKIHAYYDIWEHPWFRSTVDVPSGGNEVFAKITYNIKRKFQIYLIARSENKQRNVRSADGNRNVIYDQNRSSLRLHLANKVSKSLELRNRVELVNFTLDNPATDAPLVKVNLLNGDVNISNTPGYRSFGFMIYQDVIFKPLGSPWSFTGRYALFDTDDFDSRVYAYENDLLYTFTVPAYAYRGSRVYVNIRYRGIRNLSLEGRIAQTYISGKNGIVDFETFSSGREEIIGRTRTEVKFQLKYSF